MAKIYVVKSGLQGVDGVYWVNLKAFTDEEEAEGYANKIAKQIPPEDLDEHEFVEVEELSISQ